jgi:hypothetical protein
MNMYAPEEAIDLAMNLNFTVTISPKDGTRFERGPRHIWGIRSGWQTADVIDGMFTNHQKFDSVIDALRRPA